MAIYHNNEMVFDHEITGPWNVAFDTIWGGPASIQFDRLTDWKDHANNGIKYYSGTATYTKTFDLPADLRGGNKPIYLDLGHVKDMAEVTLNGTNLGVVWCEPFQLEISSAVKEQREHFENRCRQQVVQSPAGRRDTEREIHHRQCLTWPIAVFIRLIGPC